MDFPYPMEEHDARLMVNDPQANAYAWIVAYAASLSNESSSDDDDEDYGQYGTVTADELISAGLANVKHGPWSEYINKGGLLEGESTDPMFWEMLARLYKIEISDEVRSYDFFTCSC